jgi:hypothetical protein
MHYIQKEIRKNTQNYGEHLYEVYRNNLLGLDEMIKKQWAIADSPKTDSKEKIKALVLIGEYYRERSELIRYEPDLVKEMKRAERMKQWSISIWKCYVSECMFNCCCSWASHAGNF